MATRAGLCHAMIGCTTYRSHLVLVEAAGASHLLLLILYLLLHLVVLLLPIVLRLHLALMHGERLLLLLLLGWIDHLCLGHILPLQGCLGLFSETTDIGNGKIAEHADLLLRIDWVRSLECFQLVLTHDSLTHVNSVHVAAIAEISEAKVQVVAL